MGIQQTVSFYTNLMTNAHHYTESGLTNVWLTNGFKERVINGEKAVSIPDADQLHEVIGRTLARKPHLTGSEFRFLRKELGLSQSRIGQIVGSSEQTVSLWERRGKIPIATQRLIKFVYLSRLDGNSAICDALDRIIELDAEPDPNRFVFEETQSGWKDAA